MLSKWLLLVEFGPGTSIVTDASRPSTASLFLSNDNATRAIFAVLREMELRARHATVVDTADLSFPCRYPLRVLTCMFRLLLESYI